MRPFLQEHRETFFGYVKGGNLDLFSTEKLEKGRFLKLCAYT